MAKQNDDIKLQERLIDLMNKELLEDFSDLYFKSLLIIKSYEHIELLLYACRFGLLSFVKKILNNNSTVINVNCYHPSTGFPPLFIAIRSQKHLIIEYLIREAKADVNWSCDKIGRTCLDEAIRRWDLSTVALLIEHRTIVDQRHLFLSIIECFREKDKKRFPLKIFDIIIDNRPELINDVSRKTAIEFVIRQASWSSINPSDVIVSLLQKLSVNNNSNLIENVLSSSVDKCRIKCGNTHRTQVGIIGAGPAGLMIGALLYEAGIDSIIIEQYSRSYVESNTRAGVLEQSTVDLLDEVGASKRLFQEGIIQRNINLQFNGERMNLPITELTQGKVLTFYGQHLILEDLIQLRIESGQRLWFDIEYVQIERHDLTDDGRRPLIRFRRRFHEEEEEIECDFIAGCDGATSKCCRRSIPPDIIDTIEHTYPYSWLSILVEAPPSGNELVYSHHAKYGFAVHSLRSLKYSRFHLQVPLNDTLDDWPDERIWNELKKRLTPNDRSWTINEGPILQRALFPLRNLINIPMQYKRLFLVGDAAHIVPPTAAKGLNVAIKDAYILSKAFIYFYENDKLDKLNDYTTTCLLHIFQAEEFATYMTLLLHKLNISEQDDHNQNKTTKFEQILQRARQQELQRSKTLQHYVAQMFVH